MKALTHPASPGHFVRWTPNERIQHWILALSFIVLVITGFALKYPESGWVRLFAGPDWIFELRGIIHRVAGTVFLTLGIYHVVYMLSTDRGRSLGRALLPNLRDARDMRQYVGYNLGLSREGPRFGHFSYMEKAEYWALIWGTVIMGATGLMLWFEETTLRFLPRWSIDLVTVIHLYEAWLATLAILVWHFYYVIFNPDVYPINTSMVNGRITERELREEYGGEYLELQAARAGDDQAEGDDAAGGAPPGHATGTTDSRSGSTGRS
jgi:formate dehydrogenase gamma subunit